MSCNKCGEPCPEGELYNGVCYDCFLEWQAKEDERERAELSKGICPDSGLPLTTWGNVQIPPGTLSCSVCDCFGYPPEAVKRA